MRLTPQINKSSCRKFITTTLEKSLPLDLDYETI